MTGLREVKSWRRDYLCIEINIAQAEENKSGGLASVLSIGGMVRGGLSLATGVQNVQAQNQRSDKRRDWHLLDPLALIPLLSWPLSSSFICSVFNLFLLTLLCSGPRFPKLPAALDPLLFSKLRRIGIRCSAAITLSNTSPRPNRLCRVYKL